MKAMAHVHVTLPGEREQGYSCTYTRTRRAWAVRHAAMGVRMGTGNGQFAT